MLHLKGYCREGELALLTFRVWDSARPQCFMGNVVLFLLKKDNAYFGVIKHNRQNKRAFKNFVKGINTLANATYFVTYKINALKHILHGVSLYVQNGNAWYVPSDELLFQWYVGCRLLG